MKSLTLLSIILITGLNSYSQECTDLYLSEILFEQGVTLTEGGYINHSIEVYNPTKSTIDLKDYSLYLHSQNELSVTINLSGTIFSNDVVVISNSEANESIASVTDISINELLFEGYTSIELRKLNTTIDKIGSDNAVTEDIDFELLLTDPNYLNSLSINLGSIRNLLMRRSRLVQNGTPNFQNVALTSQWKLYPSSVKQDIGFHTCSCLVPVLFWDGATQLFPEDEIFESDPLTVLGTIVLSEEADNDITIFIQEAGSEYTPADPQAVGGFDYFTPIDPTIDIVIPAGVTEQTFDLLTPVNDDISEGDEGAGFLFDIVNDGGTGATVDFLRERFDIRIKEITTSTNDLLSEKMVSVYPNLFSDFVNIENKQRGVDLLKIEVHGLDSKTNVYFDFDGNFHLHTLDLSILYPGYYLMIIHTSSGIIYKQLCKQ